MMPMRRFARVWISDEGFIKPFQYA